MNSTYRDEFNKTTKEVKWTFWKVTGLIVGALIVLSVIGYALGWFSDAAEVAKDEFGPKAAMEKYEWFINQATNIEKMDQDIVLYQQRVASVDSTYAAYGKDKSTWPPDIRTTYNHEKQTAKDDLLAIASQRNNLVKEYNAASQKFNWTPFQTKPDKPKETYLEYKTPQ